MEKACYTHAFCKSFPRLRNISKTLLSLQLKISIVEEIIWEPQDGGKFIEGENARELIPRTTVLKISSFFPQREDLIRTWLPFRIFRGYL